MLNSALNASGHEVEQRLFLILLQLSVIILVARLFATLFRRLKQPMAVGELAAGLVSSVSDRIGIRFRHLRTNMRSALGISISGIVLPLGLGIGLGHWLYPHLGETLNLQGFTLFLGTAMSITALPMLARMMQELGITRTRLGTIAITAAAVDDAAGWVCDQCGLRAWCNSAKRVQHACIDGVADHHHDHPDDACFSEGH